MRKVLPVREPAISAYTSYGCLFSIMDDDLWPWVFNHFIQIRYAYTWGIYAFDSHHLLLKNCPGISFYHLPREIITAKWGRSLRKVITEAVDMGYYLYIYVDRYYLSATNSYRQETFEHEVLLFGYDLERNTVLAADNFKDGQFVFMELPFEEIEQGYWSIHGEYSFLTDIRYLKVEKQYDSRINLEQITEGLYRYLNSKQTFDLIVEQQFDHGIQAITRLFADITSTRESGSRHLDRRAFHLLYEHKIIMELRVRYLMENQFIAFDEALLHEAAALKQDFLILRNLVLKFNLKNDYRLLDHIHSMLKENLLKEQRFISSLLAKLSASI